MSSSTEMNNLKYKLGELRMEFEQIGYKNDKIRKTEIMQLLHEYNEIKDATQIILAAIAMKEGKTVKDVHIHYNLPLDS